MRDERYFSNSNTFDPDRFLVNASVHTDKHVHKLNTFGPNDPSCIAFGFGRRICPGRFMADANLWLLISNMLAVFDFLPPIDPLTGKEVIPELKWTGGLTT